MRRILILFAAFQLTAWQGRAATITVCDEGTLRSAIAQGGNIQFGCDGVITLSSLIVVSNTVSLDGTGRSVRIDGNNAVRLFRVMSNGNFTVRGLTLSRGLHAGADGVAAGSAGSTGFGGAIWNEGRLRITNCVIMGHTARGGNGAVSAGSGGEGRGGAIHSTGPEVSIQGTLMVSNTCTGGGGADLAPFVFGPAGAGGYALGAAIYVEEGTVNIEDVLFRDNRCQGGLAGRQGAAGDFGQGGFAYGGAVYGRNATGRIAEVTFMNNQAEGARSPFNGGSGAAYGGAVYVTNGSWTVTDSVFSNNVARSGQHSRHGFRGPGVGGALVGVGHVTVGNSLFRANSAIASGAGASGMEARAGAIENQGWLSLAGCTFAYNQALGGSSANAAGLDWPGGPGIAGALYNLGTAEITNSTFAFNSAKGGSGLFSAQGGTARGGGIANAGIMALTHVTIASNTAQMGRVYTNYPAGDGGGIFTTNGSSILKNSLLAHGDFGSNSFGVVSDQGNNLSSDASCQFSVAGSLNNADPKLSPLLDFGGPTPTMALLKGSPAIDAASSLHCTAFDQRGVARPFGAACDIGAFESAPPFSVRGVVSGYGKNGLQVSADTYSTSTSVDGSYTIWAPPGNYDVTPEGSNVVCLPNQRPVILDSDLLGVNFKSYRLNALTVEAREPNGLYLIYAGEAGQTHAILADGDLSEWQPISTNMVGTDRVFHYHHTNAPGVPRLFFQTRRVD